MSSTKLVDVARDRALDILGRCVIPEGFRASALPAGYPQIWARDSMVAFLGAVASQDSTLMAAGRASLETMSAFQSPMGLIQLNVNPDTGYVSTENAGAVDANLWYVLGHYLHFQVSGDAAFLSEHWTSIERAIEWLTYQDMNECGLLEVPEAGDWMDLLAVRYNVLYDNVLYYAALLAYEELHKHLPAGAGWRPQGAGADGVHERLNLLMW
ncbi:MAG TPA: GH116 family glycosyl hydrolase, partial [Anaerolineae bacterium]|nr:GH116 family glycosyl hydrolase [Anaerolineae bacterium]